MHICIYIYNVYNNAELLLAHIKDFAKTKTRSWNYPNLPQIKQQASHIK
jgi:hypothetical protein